MTSLKTDVFYEVIDATWPAAARSKINTVTIRDGQGGGKRASAATVDGELDLADLERAEQAMADLDQDALFMIRQGDEALDVLLENQGYKVVDPVTIYAIDAEVIATQRPPRTVAIQVWEPLRIMEEIWALGGIGPDRIGVMHRACDPKSGFISRWQDKPGGAFFTAMHNGIVMVHALEILPYQRRLGLGRWAMIRAAFWTLDNGGHTIAAVCTKSNTEANALYASLGMNVVGQYHYRIKTNN